MRSCVSVRACVRVNCSFRAIIASVPTCVCIRVPAFCAVDELLVSRMLSYMHSYSIIVMTAVLQVEVNLSLNIDDVKNIAAEQS